MQPEDIETAFKTVDMDKSGEISKRVIFFSQPFLYILKSFRISSSLYLFKFRS